MDLKEKRKLDDGGKDQPLGPVSKQRKVIGPSLPLPQQIADATSQASSDDDDDDDDDDDFGPSLPPSDPSGGLMQATSTAVDVASTAITTDLGPETQRDQWMLQPPSQSDWSSKVDPTQLRTRKFNTGKSATAPKQMDSAWVETPEQRMRRLQDAVMGIGPSTCQTATPLRTSKTQSMEDQIKKYKVCLRL